MGVKLSNRIVKKYNSQIIRGQFIISIFAKTLYTK